MAEKSEKILKKPEKAQILRQDKDKISDGLFLSLKKLKSKKGIKSSLFSVHEINSFITIVNRK
jgi:hypothetical protein